jgi:DNA polymerase elongation subunit (family B)
MKILINAAYGYMGAGKMALFADSRAADEVTRRGRAILTQVLDALRQRGMALIEADTDGVYFAAPPGWSEMQERTLVSAIAAELPAGINLEYEGRYRAIFSHEVKNYALLTYSGRLVVHGVALRSSRAEPFGERFLRQALYCALTGNVPGIRNAFEETTHALSNRELPASDMAAGVRLSKTPETYLAMRETHQEPAYEALLKAGRTRWYPGERVRFYKMRGKQYIWVPEETIETTSNDDLQPGTQQQDDIANRHDYDVDHYLRVLVSSYAARLRKAFSPDDFARLFRLEQPGLFDQPIETIQPLWIRCQTTQTTPSKPEKTEADEHIHE